MQSRKLIVGLIVVMASTGCAAEPSKEDLAKKGMDGIQGTWQITALETGGEQAPAEITNSLKLVFKDDWLTFTPGEPGFTNYTYKLDTTTKPASFDMIHADGESKGKIMKGIYSWDGDRLKICFGSVADRPTEFSAKSDSGRALYLLKPVKP